MIKKIFLLVVAIFVFQNVFGQQTCPIIPLPKHYKAVNAQFLISSQTPVIAEDTAFCHAAAYFLKNQLLRYTGIPLASKANGAPAIFLKKDNSVKTSGGYTIHMQADMITISAGDSKGIFNGVASLLQLALFSDKQQDVLALPCWNIQDAPLYSWRGVMLDESRHFFGKRIVKEILDQMALLKLNRFHWHLTDQPGWRIQINQYPRLALVGGIGNHSDSLAPAKYYTQQDIREIVAYAQARNITVIPEIDMPGHATAANRAYPQYSGGGSGRFADFTFNPGQEGTYQYLTNILKEVAVLFPAGMVHLGGDEVSFGSKSWKKDTAVQHLMQKNKLTDLQAVEHYFFKRMTDSALHYFNKILAWDEVADDAIPQDSVIIFWWRHNKPEQLTKALTAGFQVVLCPRIPLYFDFVQDSTHLQGRRWGKDFSSLKQVYLFSGHTYPAAEKAPQLILGMQANLWTEKVRSERRLEFLLFPRIAALAEAAWTVPQNRDYEAFLARLKQQFSLYKKDHLYYFNPITPEKTPEAVDIFN